MLEIAQIDSKRRFIVSKVTGNLTMEDIHAHLQRKAAEQLFSYHEIVDVTDGLVDFSVTELQKIGDAVANAQPPDHIGAVVIVTTSSFVAILAKVYNALVTRESAHLHVVRTVEEGLRRLEVLDADRESPEPITSTDSDRA